MATTSSLLKPIGVFTGAFCTVQALGWSILSLLGILTYTCVIDAPDPQVDGIFNTALYCTYFLNGDCTSNIEAGLCISLENFISPNISTISPEVTNRWIASYLGFSLAWLIISGLLLQEFYRFNLSKSSLPKLYAWTVLSAGICAMDFAAGICYGLDYGTMKENNKYGYDAPPAFMMSMFMRGYTIWAINVALVSYIGYSTWQLRRELLIVRPTKTWNTGTSSLFYQPQFRPSYLMPETSPKVPRDDPQPYARDDITVPSRKHSAYQQQRPEHFPGSLEDPGVELRRSPNAPWPYSPPQRSPDAAPWKQEDGFQPRQQPPPSSLHQSVPYIPTRPSNDVNIPRPDYTPPNQRRQMNPGAPPAHSGGNWNLRGPEDFGERDAGHAKKYQAPQTPRYYEPLKF